MKKNQITKNSKMAEEEIERLKDQIIKAQEKSPMLQTVSLKAIKLKDNYGRGGLQIDLREVFKFIPEVIVIQKVKGRNNVIVVSAVLTEAMLLKEEKQKKKEGGQKNGR